MRKTRLLIILCIVLIIIFTGCEQESEYEVNSLKSPSIDYKNQLFQICSELEDDEISKIILNSFYSQYQKMSDTRIIKNEGLEKSLQLLVLTSMKPDEELYEIEPLVKIPFGRRYAVIQQVAFEEQKIRRVVIVVEVDEENKIIEPYHFYVVNVESKLLYRGEGALKAVSYEADRYEYGRMPDIVKEK